MLKEKDIRSILNRLRWDESFNFEDCEIKYIDRVNKTLMALSCSEIEGIGHKFLFLKGDIMLPIHRVVEIKYKGKTIWSKSNR